jgi:hypothetical protein
MDIIRNSPGQKRDMNLIRSSFTKNTPVSSVKQRRQVFIADKTDVPIEE